MPRLGRLKENLTGQTRGKWYVIGSPERRDRGGGRLAWFWECRCACGTVQYVSGENLLAGSQSCKPCAQQANIKAANRPGIIRVRKFTVAMRQEMATGYQSGMTLEELATKFGGHPTTIWQHLKTAGVELRGPEEAGRIHTLNQQAFALPLSDGAAYWVGFLMADGCVSDRQTSVAIQLALCKSDRGHVESFREFLGSSHPLCDQPSHPGSFAGNNGQGMVRLAVYSRRLATDLARYGVVPRKSCVAVPAGGIDMVSAFWRGMVDGDGHIMNTDRGPVIGLTGSLGCVSGFLDFARRLAPHCEAKPAQQGNIYHGRVGNQIAIAVMKELYERDGPALPRKAELARRLIVEDVARLAAKAPPAACSVPGCEREPHGLGFCKMHHKRFRKHGSPNAVATAWGGPVGGPAVGAKPMRKRRCDAKPDGFKVPMPRPR